jgi:signal transduction histidine kinase
MAIPTSKRSYVWCGAVFIASVLIGTTVLAIVLPAQRWGVVAMAAVALAIGWVVARLTHRRLRDRVHELREAADALGQGDLIERVAFRSDDDFLKLAESLDRVADHLRRATQEHARLEQQLLHREKLATIGELAATVGHEINNPLDGLQNSLRIIRRDASLSDQSKQLLDMMEDGLQRMEQIVQRLLRMARDMPLCLEPTRVVEFVEDATAFVRPRLNRHSIELVMDVPDGSVSARTDATAMSQVLINLMINAADAMPEGGRLTIRCATDSSTGDVVIALADTGQGIAAADLPHVFDPFFTKKQAGRGTGLGLSIVRRIVEAHEGRIEVASEPNAGTTFTIRLPQAPAGMQPKLLPSSSATQFKSRVRPEVPGTGNREI